MSGNEEGDDIEMDPDKLSDILETEFLIYVDRRNLQELKRAAMALEIFESIEDFMEKTGWNKNNPELQSEKYLTENRICRWIEGKAFYFSRLLWEEYNFKYQNMR